MINRANPITNGMLACYTCQEKLGMNLVTSQKAAEIKGQEYVATKYGVFPNLDNTSVGNNSTADTAIRYFKNIGWNAGAKTGIFTAMTFGTFDTSASNDITPYITDRNNVATDWSFQLLVRASTLGSNQSAAQLNTNDGAGSEMEFFTTNTITDNNPHIIFGRYFGDDTNPCLDMWLDGNKETAGPNSVLDSTGYSINTSSTNDLCCGAYYNFSGQYSATGTHFISAYWNRNLTDAEIISLSKDPFQLLLKQHDIFLPGIRSEDVTPPLIVRVR